MSEKTISQHFSNDQVDFTVQRKPHCIVEFSAKASAVFTKSLYDKAVKAVAKEVSVPGFRKGKAPEHMIKSSHATAIDKQWQQFLGNDVFRACELLCSIPTLNRDTRVQYRLNSHSLEGADILFSFESEPQVPDVDPSLLTPTPVPLEDIDEKKVQEVLDEVRLFFAKWIPIADRGVQDKDFVEIHLDSLEGETSERVASNSRLEINSNLTPWLYQLLIGMKPNEEREGVSAPGSNASEEEKAHFTPKKVRVTLLRIEEAELPLVDDAFAQKIGAESADILKERLTTLLQKRAKQVQKQVYHDELSHLLSEKYIFDIPHSLLHAEIKHRIDQLFKDPKARKDFSSLSEDEKKQRVENIRVHAESALRLFYLCKKIALENNLVIHPSEIDFHPTSLLDAMFADRELTNPNKTDEQRNLATSRLLLEKALDHLLDKILH
ncbi:MAG: hypothetical protein FJZ63_03820 [Chlamydiae bacterium]|nr:hypothetical protein [Chlamydiota bacterium]